MKNRIIVIILFTLLLPTCLISQVSIGDILCTDESIVTPQDFPSSGKTAWGIVFHVDATDTHGWAVALNNQSSSIKWCRYYEYDILNLPNISNARNAMHDLDGHTNTGIIRAEGNSSIFPAAWAVDYDNGWYLPSAGQLRYLYSCAPEINASLQVVGGAAIPYQNNNYWWSSTEHSPYHAFDMNSGGSTGDYLKDNSNNYPPSGIAVRQIRDFTIQQPVHPTYHIGDMITNEDGSRGILFYVSPDQTDGWMVALNDAASAISWGDNTDVPGLNNQTCAQPFGALLDETNGFANTGSIRNHQNGTATAANAVNYQNGWYLPTAGQLLKLFGSLAFIEDKLQTYGTTLAEDYYWSSSEANDSQAFCLSCAPMANVRAGHCVRALKSNPFRVRAVRNIIFENPVPVPGLPDNILESDCNHPMEGSAWNIQLLASSPDEDIASYSPILVGDIDGNGVTDIVVAKYNGNNYRSCRINVYSGLDLSLQHSFSVPDTIYLSNGPYAIGRYPKANGSMQGAIFTHCYDKRIRAYAIDGTLLNVSDRPTSCDGMVSLADFNGDGYPEVYSGNDIFDAATLKWLCSGPSNGNKGLSYRGTPSYSNGTYHHTYYAMSLAYDALGDATQELICGNTIYYVNIVSRTNPSQNSVTVAKTIAPPNGFSSDGHVCMADFDLDGETEILVIRDNTNDQTVDDTYFYAYKPSNGQILFQEAYSCASTSYVFIGNTDADPYPEIIFLENQPNGYYEEILCWRYTPQNGLETLWSQYHDDRSGMTAMTLFDFNQDNVMELVYRDNNHLRIINASGKSHITGNDTIRPYNIYMRAMAAGTGIEYPVVADVNGDGHAEIVVTGLLDQYYGYDVGYGGVHVFGSPGNWSPARPVWNQYMYHVTNVNEDLTIPTYCFNTATVFTGSDGTIRRPYNNFLQQAYYITPQGEPIGIHGNPQYVDLYGVLNGSYVWNGTIYTQPGDYSQYFTDINGCDSIVTLHLTTGISDYPDNILVDECNTPLQSFEWGISEDWSSNDNIYCRINPLVGDLDDDGIPEIVCFDMQGNSPSQTAAQIINVYDGRSKALKAQITVDAMVWAHGNGPYGLVKLPNRKGLIVTACKDTRLYAYDITAANPSNPVWVSNESYNTGYNDFSVSIGFADFNGDGHPEIYVRNKIFDAETGILLATAQGGYNQADSYSHNSHTNFNKLSCPIAFDICGDTRQELILGNEIYNVVITNRNGTSGNHATLTKSITPPNNIINDGHVQVADFNLDGHPDILISNRDNYDYYGIVSFYVWDVFNNRTSQPIQLETHFTGKSVPLIADFDNDGRIEVLIDCAAADGQGQRAYRFNPSTNSFNHLWTLAIDEDSYSNTATLFDFNNDGRNELVLTDNSNLLVYDLSTNPPTLLSSIDCGEITIMHVPIVADVDNDGSAEIVVTGKAGGYMQANTMLKVYKSATEPWRSARKVWNQYMYHVTNVNEDLTIPTFCFNTATVFTGSDGTIRRPYNNFLQQAGYITPQGEPYNPSGYVEAEHYGEGCESYSFHGVTYTESGDFEYLIENPLGCDTLMTVHVHLGDTIHATQYKSVCQPYTWNGITYEESGIYQQTFTSVHGCDSIVTLYLNIGEAIMTNMAVNTCDSYTWNGTVYTESGIYEQTFTSTQDCDSIVVLDLTIKASAHVSQIHGESLIYYQATGTYTYSIDPVEGCFGYDWTLEGPWSITSSPDSPECTVNINSPGSATLKVRVYTECGYIERSLFINHDARPDIVIYPNPTQGEFNIVLYGMQGETVIVIYDYLGQFIGRFNVDTDIQGTVVPYSLAGKAAGVYMVTAINHYNMVTKKVIKDTASSYGIYDWNW